MADVVVLVAAQAGEYRDHEATAPWTRPENEFVAPWGMFTTAEFALIARRHMHVYGTTREQLSIVAATIRNNGSRNPEAVYYQRGPFTPDDITASRPVADPFHLLDCATTSEGGCALVVANIEQSRTPRADRSTCWAAARTSTVRRISTRPAWDLAGRRGDHVNGVVGRRAAERAFSHAGLRRDDVDVLELYDPFSFEIIRQLEAFGFCGDGEGGPFVADGHIAIDGSHPITTDGGTMSFSHAGANPQMMQRAIRAVQQLRGAGGRPPGARRACCVVQQRGSGSAVHHGAAPGRRAAMTSDNSALQPQTGPVPHASSSVSAPFWQGCRSEELRYQRCEACGLSNFPPTEHCRQCLSAELRLAAERRRRRDLQLDGGPPAGDGRSSNRPMRRRSSRWTRAIRC